MGEAWLDRIKERLAISRPIPFTYSSEDRQFLVGAERRELADIPRHGLRHSQAEDIPPAEVDRLIAEEPLVHTFSSPIALPRFEAFIQKEWSDALSEEVVGVMAAVMPEVPFELRSPSRDHLGFGATKIDRDMGRIVLQVPGICACIGPDATTPFWGSKTWRDGVFEYTTHNIDKPVQRAALLAGLGHLALLAKA